jgi:hypothetical protein
MARVGITVKVRTLVWVALFESVTLTVVEKGPDVVGVPVIVPAAGSRASPIGSEPVMLHVYGGTPPVAAKVAE